MRGMVGRGIAAALGAASLIGLPTVAAAQAAKAGVVTTLQGTATVARASAPQPAPLKFKDDVFVQDHIVTGESSIVRILLGGKAVVTVRERSALTIHETPTTSTIEIASGKIALAVAKDRMKPGESVQIKTPNAMAGIRGTVVIADVAPAAEAGGTITTRFTLLTGIVDVTRVDGSTGRPAGPPALLHPLQTIAVTGGMPPGAVRAISRTEALSIAKDYKVSLPAPPPPANRHVTEQQIEAAVRHSAALAGAQPATDAGQPTGDETESDETDRDLRRAIAVDFGGGGDGGRGHDTAGGGIGGGVGIGGGGIGVGGGVRIGGGGDRSGGGDRIGLGGDGPIGRIIPKIRPPRL